MPVSSSENIKEIENSLGYAFKNKKFLTDALTHKSFHHESSDKTYNYNERLEFLGDSVLGLIIAETLFLHRGLFTEADMSKMKSYLVKESVLFEMASKLALGKYLRLGKGEESTGGRQKRSVLSNALEALVGAIFLDSDYATTRSIVLKLFSEKIPSVISKKEGYDFKSELQEESQSLFGLLPEYRIVKQEGEEHKKTFTAEVYINKQLYGSGTGKSKKEAQMSAAKEALERLLKS
ncbi:MAG: ribonuclease III [Nitrospirae bacterium]|nr:ribonuclease III [Nitrospirota bacterium]MCL5237324.1 ribonuclease III [Nitrospirota bacterium]